MSKFVLAGCDCQGAKAAIANLMQIAQRKKALSACPRDEFGLSPQDILTLERRALQTLANGIEDEVLWQVPKRFSRKWFDSEAAESLVQKLKELLDETFKGLPLEVYPTDRKLKKICWAAASLKACSNGRRW